MARPSTATCSRSGSDQPLSGQHEQSLEQHDFVTDAALVESHAPQQALKWQEALNALSSGNPNGGVPISLAFPCSQSFPPLYCLLSICNLESKLVNRQQRRTAGRLCGTELVGLTRHNSPASNLTLTTILSRRARERPKWIHPRCWCFGKRLEQRARARPPPPGSTTSTRA